MKYRIMNHELRIKNLEFRALREIPYSTLFIQKIMSFTNFQKTIALSCGVLVLSVAVALVVIAWTGPTAEPPLNNALEPLNTGDTAQVKTGDLTVGNLSLDDSTGKGDINNAANIIGGNDLFLHSGATQKAEILLDEDGGAGIKFYTGGVERMVIGDDGNLYVPGLSDCFLEVTATGKVRCYTGGGVPGGNVLATTQVQVASCSGDCSDSYTIIDTEKVVRAYASVNNTDGAGSRTQFWFYITPNGEAEYLAWHVSKTNHASYSGSKYYHVRKDDKVRVRTDDWGGVVSGRIYKMGSERGLITHAFSDGNILYWYDQTAIGEMSPAGAHFIGQDPPLSVIITASSQEDVSWILD